MSILAFAGVPVCRAALFDRTVEMEVPLTAATDYAGTRVSVHQLFSSGFEFFPGITRTNVPVDFAFRLTHGPSSNLGPQSLLSLFGQFSNLSPENWTSIQFVLGSGVGADFQPATGQPLPNFFTSGTPSLTVENLQISRAGTVPPSTNNIWFYNTLPLVVSGTDSAFTLRVVAVPAPSALVALAVGVAFRRQRR